MKILAATASALLIIKGAAAIECPNSISLGEWGEKELTDALTFRYAVVLATGNEQSILCGRFESDIESYIGFGISPTGTMSGGEGIIGLPDAGTVQKYNLGVAPRVDLMPDDQQTLMFNGITQEDGKTVMEFAKYLAEDGEQEIYANGDNVFLWWLGSNNELGLISGTGDFTLDFETTRNPSSSTTPAPSYQGSNSGGMDEVAVATGVGKTMSPTAAPPPRGEPPRGEPAAETPGAGASNPVVGGTDTISDADTPDDAAPAPAESAPSPVEQPSGAMVNNIASTIIVGAGVIAMWFGV